MTDCLFCRIARKEVSAVVVHEDDDVLAFLDIGPIRPGHTQIIPKRHFDYFEMLPPDLSGKIMQLGQGLARAMKQIYGVPRVAFLFSGGDVAHAHAHVVPMVSSTDITSRRYIVEDKLTFLSLPRPSAEETSQTAAVLSQSLREEELKSAAG